MSEILVAEASETMSVAYLGSVLPGVDVGTRRPNPLPDKFIRVTRTGGTRDSLVLDTANLLLEVWSTTDADAEDLALLVQGHWLGWAGKPAGHGVVYDTSADAPVPLTDPESGRTRYTITTSVTTQSRPL